MRIASCRLLVFALAAFAACKGQPEIAFEIALPSSLVDTAAWFEIGAFKDASCTALESLTSFDSVILSAYRAVGPRKITTSDRSGFLSS